MDVSAADVDLDDFIKELSKHIGSDWKVLARSLGLEKTDIDAVSYDNQGSLQEQIYQFFEKWKQRNGRNAIVEQLMDGLRDAELFDQLEMLQKAGFPVKDADTSPHEKPEGSITCGKEEQENCYCGIPVMKRIVKKKKNKGRVFYNCSKPIEEQCHYYRWKEDERPPPPPHCGKCGLSCIFRISERRNENWGKKFWRCSTCGFHDWIEKRKQPATIKKGPKRRRSYRRTSTKLAKKMKLDA